MKRQENLPPNPTAGLYGRFRHFLVIFSILFHAPSLLLRKGRLVLMATPPYTAFHMKSLGAFNNSDSRHVFIPVP